MRSVLFVCTANICRSPMAAGLLNEKVKTEADQWIIGSAGVYAQDGLPAAQNTLVVLRLRGIDWSGHRSQGINKQLLEKFGLILTMEQGHKEALQAAFPIFGPRINLLTEMVAEYHDIVDPIGKPLIEYEDTAREIDSILARGFLRIRELAEISKAQVHG